MIILYKDLARMFKNERSATSQVFFFGGGGGIVHRE